ncbi:MAG: hypothetical protein QOJ01_673 [Solirubrobacterales bacterium]|nr:hypothetical protein [Solirubrobacterales bacterium]
MVALPLAHLLHWYFMPLYAAPMLIVLYSTIKETIRQRRKPDEEPKPVPGPPEDGPPR